MAQGRVTILVYHSISDASEDRIRVPNRVTPDHFADQMKYLAQSAHVIAFDEYLGCVRYGRALPPRAVIITFDDGYRDNLTDASAILRHHQLPATFFLATDYIGMGRLKWEDRLSCLIRRSRAPALTLDLPGLKATFRLRTEREEQAAIHRLVRLLSRQSRAEQQRVLSDVEQQSGAICEEGDVMLTWDEVRQLARTPGMSIGGHSASHVHLDRLSPGEVEHEAAACKRLIEGEIRQPVTLFAYPYGSCRDDARHLLQPLGYDAACTLDYGRNDVTSDLFRLKRVSVPNRRGIAFQVGMALRGSVAGEAMKRSYNIVRRLA